ncbi:sensor histidine kinase [Polymorphospora sp. NPDC051019]|uniref:ATP-binding protein n=1 Tax=Polymorphospora sp. NPDC051019 TaxID=3155725 RepID=UPI003436A013
MSGPDSAGSPGADATLILSMTLRVEQDIFVVRQRGREVADAVGFEHQDQIRIATALSEVGRLLLSCGSPADVAFFAQTGDLRPVLRIEVRSAATVRVGDLPGGHLAAVGRLVDTLEMDDDETTAVVRMSRRFPTTAPPPTPERIAELRAELEGSLPGTPLDELAVQNEQLLAALEQVRTHRDHLARLNEELEETNRGVMALYGQLSEELEETNRGVVALYAELDEKSSQLRAASEAKSRFLANVSHELRAPVTAIIGLGRLMADPASDPLTPQQATHVELIRSSAADLLSLVNDLLDLAKAESGRIEPNWSDIDLRMVFGQLRGTLRALTTPDVRLEVEDPPAPSVIRSDEVLLTRVLRNLLHNGLKFTERGEVRMCAETAAGGWRVSVVDTGLGIPAELHQRIFEEFYQVPGTAKPGTGLGLPYARRLATLLGGSLELTSEPGHGSTFTLFLPTVGDGA